MAYDDTLFQLGMDLARGSSTAQKEDHVHRADVALQDDRKDEGTERDCVRFAGKHLTIDLFGARRLDDLDHIEATLKRCIEGSGAKLRHIHLYPHTSDEGVSGIAVLSKSHISFYSVPETGMAVIDVLAGGELHPHRIVDDLKAAFDAKDVSVKDRQRASVEAAMPIEVAQPKKAGARIRSAA